MWYIGIWFSGHSGIWSNIGLDDLGVLAVGTVWRTSLFCVVFSVQARGREGGKGKACVASLSKLHLPSLGSSGSMGCLCGWAGEFLRHEDAPGRSHVLCQGVGEQKQLLTWVLSRTRGCAAHLIPSSGGCFAGRHRERGCSEYNIGKDEKTSGWQ